MLNGEMRKLSDLRPNPLNPRKSGFEASDLEDLVASIKGMGLLQPLVITPDNLIVAGHRRAAACKLAKLTEVPVVVRDWSPAEQIAAMLVENLQRKELNPVETAMSCRELEERGVGVDEISHKIGVSVDTVRNHLRILELPKQLRDRIATYEMPMGYVPHLVRIEDPAARVRIAEQAMRENWLVAELAGAVKRQGYIGGRAEHGREKKSRSIIARNAAVKSGTPSRERLVDLFVELTAALRRHPDLAKDPVVTEWVDRLAETVRIARKGMAA